MTWGSWYISNIWWSIICLYYHLLDTLNTPRLRSCIASIYMQPNDIQCAWWKITLHNAYTGGARYGPHCGESAEEGGLARGGWSPCSPSQMAPMDLFENGMHTLCTHTHTYIEYIYSVLGYPQKKKHTGLWSNEWGANSMIPARSGKCSFSQVIRLSCVE